MNYRIATMFLAGLVIAPGWTMGQAQAGCCGGGHGYDYGYLYGVYGLDVYERSDRRIPYFSLHPPVYYSYPVPRTYGYSPFAYPPGVETPQVKAPTPISLDNPYVPRRAKVKATANRTAATSRQPEPLVIVNPYVKQASVVAEVDK